MLTGATNLSPVSGGNPSWVASSRAMISSPYPSDEMKWDEVSWYNMWEFGSKREGIYLFRGEGFWIKRKKGIMKPKFTIRITNWWVFPKVVAAGWGGVWCVMWSRAFLELLIWDTSPAKATMSWRHFLSQYRKITKCNRSEVGAKIHRAFLMISSRCVKDPRVKVAFGDLLRWWQCEWYIVCTWEKKIKLARVSWSNGHDSRFWFWQRGFDSLWDLLFWFLFLFFPFPFQ